MKEYIILILAPCLVWLVWAYQNKKREEQKLSDRLHIAENNITYLKNRSYLNNRLNKKQFEWIQLLVICHTIGVTRSFGLASSIQHQQDFNRGTKALTKFKDPYIIISLFFKKNSFSFTLLRDLDGQSLKNHYGVCP